MSDIKELIRKEIIRMHQQAVLASCGNDTDWLRSRIGTCVDILDFIDSLPEEKPSDDLEEAAANYIKSIDDGSYEWALMDIEAGFIAGAEWQKAKDEQRDNNEVTTRTTI